MQLFPLAYRPHPEQQKFHRLRKRFICACCGRRGGKTQAGAAEMIRRMLDDYDRACLSLTEPWTWGAGKDPRPVVRYAVVAPVYALLDECKTALQHYLGMKKEGGLIEVQGRDESGIFRWWLHGGIRIDFFSGADPDRLVSHGYHGLWLEEAARLKAAVWRDNMRPSISDHNGWAIFTTTPMGKNWLWEDVWALGDVRAATELADLRGSGTTARDIMDSEFASISWTTAQNTAIPSLAEEMEKAAKHMPPSLYRRNYHASFDAFEGQCFELEPARHTYSLKGAPDLYDISVGGDIGMTHPSAFVGVGRDGQGIWREFATDSDSNVLLHLDDAWKIRTWGDRSTWTTRVYQMLHEAVGDAWPEVPIYLPADSPEAFRYFERCGFSCHRAYQDHESAVAWMQSALHSNRFRLASSKLYRSLTNLHFPSAGERSSKLWVDEHDDEWDALRYALTAPIMHGDSPAGVELAAMRWAAGR